MPTSPRRMPEMPSYIARADVDTGPYTRPPMPCPTVCRTALPYLSFRASDRRRGVKKTCRCRHVKKICQWHIFSVDRGSYAAAASILVCTALSFSPDLGGYILLRCPKFRSGIKAAEILTAATRSPRFICHRQRSVRSPPQKRTAESRGIHAAASSERK